MCTCITFRANEFYFGRNLDLDVSFGEKVAVTPRNYPFHFRYLPDLSEHYAMIGMANVTKNYPLYAEAANEKGVCIAGLNFPGNACYQDFKRGKINIASYELIPWLLGKSKSADEAAQMLREANITGDAFTEQMPPAPLHWMLADQASCYVVEAVEEGVKIYPNPIGVLTNNPPFPFHLDYIRNFLHLSPETPENHFAKRLESAGFQGKWRLTPYGEGMGAIGLPGDVSPASRFVRACFLKWNSVCGEDAEAEISQFFHILDGVSMVRGSVQTEEGKYETTIYTCCIRPREGIYYYKTYDDSQICGVDLFQEDINGRTLSVYEVKRRQQVIWQNGGNKRNEG